MTIRIKKIESTDAQAWDTYVNNHPDGSLYHLSAWQKIIKKTYGHKTYYLMACYHDKTQLKNNLIEPVCQVVGILPLVHIKHFLFGNSLISIPFFDIGGVLADDIILEQALLAEAVKLGQNLRVKNIELRHINPLLSISKKHKSIPAIFYLDQIPCFTYSHKVRMLLELPSSPVELMKSFKSKLRSQIKKSVKQGLNVRIGGRELLNDFYNVFLVNMRDLGSPVHSKGFMQNILETFTKEFRIIMVYKGQQGLACSMVGGFKDTLENPWASFLRKYSRLSPNMLLYWSMLEYACDNGFTCFDFGRSSPDQGTYRFKEQWGAKPLPMYWHYISLDNKPVNIETSDHSAFNKAIQIWQKIPVPITEFIGPRIRKYIGL